MAARVLASLRRIRARTPGLGCDSRAWGASLLQSRSGSSSAENGAPRHRWTELPPVPLESAVRALQDIRGYNEGPDCNDDRMKRLTALRWVAKCCPNVPHSLINKLFRLRQIRMQVPETASASHGIDSPKESRLRRVSAKDTLEEGAVLCIPAAVSHASDHTRVPATKTPEATAQDIKWLRSLVLHKDEEIIVVNKPSGLAVQGGSDVGRSLDSMMGAALSYDYNEGPRLVHRLDKETSGALVVGRTHQSTVFLQALLRDKTAKLASRAPGVVLGKSSTVERCYWALVIGVPEAKEGRMSAPLAKVVTENGKLDKMRVVHETHPNAQEAVTDYKVLGSSVLGCSWLELRPQTGRKHQIRVHCAEVLGMPIVGDYKYGWRALREWPPDEHRHRHGHGHRHGLGHGNDVALTPSAMVLAEKAGAHVWSTRPALHLHCRQLVLPDVAAAFKLPVGLTLGHGKSLALVAPLPPHMVVSWNMKPLDGFPMI